MSSGRQWLHSFSSFFKFKLDLNFLLPFQPLKMFENTFCTFYLDFRGCQHTWLSPSLGTRLSHWLALWLLQDALVPISLMLEQKETSFLREPMVEMELY